MQYRDTDLEWVLKTPQRQAAYRSVGYQLCEEIESGVLIDAPAKLARILELVFKVGMDYGSVPPEVREKAERLWESPYSNSPAEKVTPKSFTQAELPYLVNLYLSHMRLVLGRDRNNRQFREATAESLVMVMRPGSPGGASNKAADKWFNAVTEGEFGWSNKAVDYLVNAGFYEEPMELEDGWKVSRITEWGFELFATGETKVVQDRQPGASSTFAEYANLAEGDLHELFTSVCALNGFTEAPTCSQPVSVTSSPRF